MLSLAFMNEMTRVFKILLLPALLLMSCETRIRNSDHRDLVPEKELPSILAEVYMADGLLSLPSIRAAYSHLDSISGYAEVIASHGYTKEMMDRTMKYYFVRKPKALEKIYDRTLAMLTEMESIAEREHQKLQAEISNMWKGAAFYQVIDPVGVKADSIDLLLEIPGYYTLSFRATFFPGDQLSPATLNAYTCHRDSAASGRRDYIRSAEYIKDGQPHDYSVRIVVPADRPLRMKGSFYDTGRHPEPWDKNAIFTNISLTFIYSAV